MFDFILSDHHLGETRMEIMQRPFANPEDMFQTILTNHNAVVKENSKVLFNGDIVSNAAKDKKYWLKRVKELNGIKTLIRGNHDQSFALEELLEVFDTVIPEGDGIDFEVKDKDADRTIYCFATHYPTRSKTDKFNIVGHIHSAWKYQKNMLNVSCDVHSFIPMKTSKIPFFLTAIEKFYDDDVWVANHPANKIHMERGKKGSYFDSVINS